MPSARRLFGWRFALAAGALAASGRAAEPLTWQQAVAEARQHNPTLTAAQLALRQADQGVTIASSGLWPTLSANAGWDRSGTQVLTQDGAGPGQTVGREYDRSGYQGGLQASLNLFNGFGTLAARAQALAVRAEREAAYAQASAALRLSLAQAFDQLVFDQKNAGLLQALGDRYHADTAYQELEFKSGRTARWTYLKSKSDEAEIQWQIAQNRHGLQADQSALAAQLGRDASQVDDLTVAGDLDIAAPPADDQADQKNLAASHPALREASAQVAAASAALTQSQSSRYPSLSANGSYGQSGADTWGPGQAQWQAGLSLNYNLFSGFAEEAAISQARQALDASRASQQDQLALIQTALRRAWTSYASAYERLPVLQLAVEAGQDRFDTVQKLYEAGRAAYLDYEQAESIFSQAQQQQLSAQLNAALAQSQYDNALGKGVDDAPAPVR